MTRKCTNTTNEVKDMPFLRGVQGEGRKWTATFSQKALGVFDYLFTDGMTIVDHKGRLSRIYRPEEVHYDGCYQRTIYGSLGGPDRQDPYQ